MWLDTLLTYSLQIGVVIVVGLLLPALFRVDQPKIRLACLQFLFFGSLLIPFCQLSMPPAVQPWVEIRISSFGTGAANAGTPIPWLELVAIVLAAGIVLRWLWLGLGMQRLLRYRTNAKPWSPVDDTLLHLQSRLQVQAELYVSNELRGPLTFGLWRPVVLLPDRFSAMPPNLREAIVCHELLHVRRRDWLMTLFEEIVRSLFWFHPAVRCLITEIQLVREQVVDRQSVEMTGSRETYLDALLEVARSRMQPAIALAPSFLGKRQIRKRVEILLKEVSMSKFRLAASCAMMLALVAGVQWFSASSFPL
jgi:beta-lactamase regulating signal transducer with metallopeptidase domain